MVFKDTCFEIKKTNLLYEVDKICADSWEVLLSLFFKDTPFKYLHQL